MEKLKLNPNCRPLRLLKFQSLFTENLKIMKKSSILACNKIVILESIRMEKLCDTFVSESKKNRYSREKECLSSGFIGMNARIQVDTI